VNSNTIKWYTAHYTSEKRRDISFRISLKVFTSGLFLVNPNINILMRNQIKQIMSLFSSSDRKKFFLVGLSQVFLSVFDLLGILLIGIS
jgi:hypothetical protein